MTDFPAQCDSCHAAMRISEDARTLDCPQCGPRFNLRPPCPYSPDVVKEAEKHIAVLNEATNGCDSETRQAILWLLEEKWLFSSGHRVTVKLGGGCPSGTTHCAICKKGLASLDSQH